MRRDHLDSCEGLLLTDKVRSRGSILVYIAGVPRRARFSTAHKLGRFLMERYVLGQGGGFVCGRSDMVERRALTRHQKQETEANLFAVSLLAPASIVTPYLCEDPDISLVQRLCEKLDLSLEATTRHYVEHSEEPLAAIWSRNGNIRYSLRGNRFPWLTTGAGDHLPGLSAAKRACDHGNPGFTEMVETTAIAWTGQVDVEIFEQTRVGKDGHALTLLWAMLPEAVDEATDTGVAELGEPQLLKSSPRR